MLASAAFRLALRGMAVFPLAPGSKVPVAGTHGCRDASSDADVARVRWAKTPNANVAIATGARSNCWVLDIDGAEGRTSLDRIEAEHGKIPLTVSAETPGNGLHLYWRWHGDGPEIRNSAGRVAPHIDVRGEGGSIVAPPSIHPNGGRYRWARNGAQGIADAPDWLVKLALPPPRPPAVKPKPIARDVSRYIASAVADELRGLAQACEPGRNDALNRAAFALAGFVQAGGLPETWAREQLEARAIEIGLPPFEARRTIGSAFAAATPRELPG